MESEIDRWFKFVEGYYAENTVPLSQKLCPNHYGYQTVGSPVGGFKLTKAEWRRIEVSK